MKTPMILVSGLLAALFAGALSARAQAPGTDGCTLLGKETAAGVPCKGGPLKAGDPRLGKATVPKAADREAPRPNSFQVGGSTVTISGSVRVEGAYAR